jgi:hypothetical protein
MWRPALRAAPCISRLLSPPLHRASRHAEDFAGCF